MCGIVGVHSHQITHKDLLSLLSQIKYRGPDETITSSFPQLNTIFGMNRLSIRDTRSGLYPFTYKNFTLIFNGEIYNLSELQKLISHYKMKTSCDGEIILPLYAKYGSKAFDLLTGMFAIAILDKKKKQIILIRDKFGEKPLYYYHHDNQFYFASEITAFPPSLKKIRNEAIPEFLTFGFIPDNHTFFENIFKLKAGEYLTYDIKKNTLVMRSYFSLTENISRPTTSDLADILQQIITEKMVSDVPLGIFLSGGVDSSLIAALAQKNSSIPIHTFSIGFKEKSVDESRYAKKVAQYLGTKHTHILMTGKQVASNWNIVINNLDEPISDPALFPTYLLAQHASRFVKVILSGEGADEIFGGYSQYTREAQINHFPFIKNPITKYFSFNSDQQKYWRLFSPLNSHYTQTIYNLLWSNGTTSKKLYRHLIEYNWHQFTHKYRDNVSLIPQSLQIHDLNYYLPEQLCMKVDKMTMRHSIESRAPFLDSRLLPYLSASAQLLSQNKTPKTLLRNVAAKHLPSSIAWRQKHGFSLPLTTWIKKDLKNEFTKLHLLNPLIIQYLSQDTANKLITDFLNYGSNELSIWNLMTLNSWLNKNASQS